MNNDTYAEKQRARDQEYLAAWDTLSPEQRRELARAGIKGPELPSYATGKRDPEKLLARAAQHESTTADLSLDGEPSAADAEVIWAVLRRLIAELLADPNPALALECLALVSGVGFMGESMTAIAARHQVTRAAVSKRCIRLTQQLDLFPARSMKSLTARLSYQTAQHQNYDYRERFDHGRSTRSRD